MCAVIEQLILIDIFISKHTNYLSSSQSVILSNNRVVNWFAKLCKSMCSRDYARDSSCMLLCMYATTTNKRQGQDFFKSICEYFTWQRRRQCIADTRDDRCAMWCVMRSNRNLSTLEVFKILIRLCMPPSIWFFSFIQSLARPIVLTLSRIIVLLSLKNISDGIANHIFT